jgi:hypothetical protein
MNALFEMFKNPLYRYVIIAIGSGFLGASVTFLSSSNRIQYVSQALDMYCNISEDDRMAFRRAIEAHSQYGNKLIAECVNVK